MHVPDNRAGPHIITLGLGFMRGRLRPALLLWIADLRNPFGIPGCPEPSVETGVYIPWGGFPRLPPQ